VPRMPLRPPLRLLRRRWHPDRARHPALPAQPRLLCLRVHRHARRHAEHGVCAPMARQPLRQALGAA
jgi:hypothetical protein